jgi:NAD(P)-dependent dehydrogenase (short-subunit alcohol dehydrogenase family)
MTTDRYLDGRTAWVTAGASGIGRACALALANRGANVAIGSLLADADWPAIGVTYRPSTEELQGVARELESNDVQCYAAPLDVSSPDSVRGFHQAATETLGQIDILVNAAAAGAAQRISKHDDENWALSLDVCLSGAYRTIKRCLPGMMERGWGRIVNIASTAANVGDPDQPAYCSAKSGLLGLTRSVALEGGPHGVSCNAINPGEVETPDEEMRYRLAHGENPSRTYEDARREWSEGHPQRRMIRAEEIGALAAFLCTDLAFGISAQDITVSGGALW